MIHEPGQADGAATDEWPTLAGEPASASALLDDSPLDDADDDWAVATSARGIRLRVPALVLVAVILVAAGFWGGAFVERGRGNSGPTGAAAGLAARFAAGGARAAGATGATGFGGATTQGTTGTISVVDGSTLYVLTSSGSLVKVTLDGSTTVTRDAKVQQDELRPGDTVVVQGATAENGTVTASSVAATAAGVTATGGGGRGFGLGGPAASAGG